MEDIIKYNRKKKLEIVNCVTQAINQDFEQNAK